VVDGINFGMTFYVALANTDSFATRVKTTSTSTAGTTSTYTWPNCDGCIIFTTQTHPPGSYTGYTTAKGVTLLQITDGTSNTVMVGERGPTPDLVWGMWGFPSYFDTVSPVYNTGTNTASNFFLTNSTSYSGYSYNCAGPAVFSAPTYWGNYCDFNHIYSFHTSGANFLFADGHVGFLGYSITQTNPGNTYSVLQALETRAGGEIVTFSN
jgi:prepilin-type processing-associated H-X9-DG protein